MLAQPILSQVLGSPGCGVDVRVFGYKRVRTGVRQFIDGGDTRRSVQVAIVTAFIASVAAFILLVYAIVDIAEH
jgi:hypothetical protein